nr:PREDICTED: uncharacterized protein LOC108217218 [Daucus carota subsp. sativus]
MALQWMILTYVVALEAAIALLVTLPTPKAVKSAIVSLVSLVLQPAMFVVPFAGFQLLGTSLSRSLLSLSLGVVQIYKSQRNVILCVSACLLYWCIYRICKYYKDIRSMEEVEKRYKDQ